MAESSKDMQMFKFNIVWKKIKKVWIAKRNFSLVQFWGGHLRGKDKNPFYSFAKIREEIAETNKKRKEIRKK